MQKYFFQHLDFFFGGGGGGGRRHIFYISPVMLPIFETKKLPAKETHDLVIEVYVKAKKE